MYKITEQYTWEPGTVYLHMGMKDVPCIEDVPAGFAMLYKKDWFENKFNERVVKEVDRTPMVLPGVFDSPWLGYINHLQISGGAKALVLLNTVPDIKVPIAAMGDNCCDLLYELSLLKPLHLCYEGYLPKFHSNQKILDVDNSLVFNANEAWDWDVKYAPYEPDLFKPPYYPERR